MTLDLIVHDAGVPPRSASALVVANVRNINDEMPVFEHPSYRAEVVEDAPPGTEVLAVRAEDADDDDFGRVSYHLSGSHASAFHIDPREGVVTVVDPSMLDRETMEFISLQV